MRSTGPTSARSSTRRCHVAGAIIAFATGLGLFDSAIAVAQTPPYKDPSLPVATRVGDLLSRMIEAKVDSHRR